MRILIYTFGTAGDVQPYVALARALQEAGHQPSLCTSEGFADLITGSGVDFRPMNNDLLELIQGGMANLRGPQDVARQFGRMQAAMRSGLDDQWEVAQQVDPELIVYHPKPLGGKHIAERLRVPGVLALPLPFYTPTTEFAVPFLPDCHVGRLNRFSYQIGRPAYAAYGSMINSFRRQIGLRPQSWLADPTRNPDGSPVTMLYPFSRHVRPVPEDYPPTAHVTGYWFPPMPEDWRPDPSLIDFLDAGDPPVYIGFGSMGFGRGAEERGQVVLSALRANRMRGIVATGWGGLAAGDTGDDVLVVDRVPHAWLFPRTAAVVHHGGAGTTGIGLAAGRPTLVCPFLGDQPFWGRQVERIGAGPASLPRRQLGSRLSERISELIMVPRFRARAAELGELISAEDGTGQAVRILERESGA